MKSKRDFSKVAKSSTKLCTVLATVFNSDFFIKLNNILKNILANVGLFIAWYCINKPNFFQELYKLITR